METSIVNSKYQITVPEKFRKKYGITPGTKVGFVEDENGNLIIRAINKEFFENFAGILKGEGDLLAELMKEKAIEKEL